MDNILTKAQKAKYLKFPAHCPICDEPLHAGECDFDIDSATQNTTCEGCGREYTEHYKLIDVDLFDEPSE